MQKDYVCGNKVDESKATAKLEYEGDTYYFDSEECKKRFESDPEAFVSRQDSSQS